MNSIDHSKNDVLEHMVKEAMEAKTKEERRAKAFDAILEFRKTTKPISTEEILQIKEELQDSIFDGLDNADFPSTPNAKEANPMSTMNFSVPDRVKEEFNKYYAGENKSAVLTRMLEEAIEEKKKRERRAKAIEAILEYRKTAPKISDEEVYRIRQEFRE